jgi:hypothetical protein
VPAACGIYHTGIAKNTAFITAQVRRKISYDFDRESEEEEKIGAG